MPMLHDIVLYDLTEEERHELLILSEKTSVILVVVGTAAENATWIIIVPLGVLNASFYHKYGGDQMWSVTNSTVKFTAALFHGLSEVAAEHELPHIANKLGSISTAFKMGAPYVPNVEFQLPNLAARTIPQGYKA